MIPDAETALAIGRVILERYYGDGLVRRYEPYRATPHPINAKEWVVAGSREDKSTAGFGGGFPELSIDKKDARVTRIALSKQTRVPVPDLAFGSKPAEQRHSRRVRSTSESGCHRGLARDADLSLS